MSIAPSSATVNVVSQKAQASTFESSLTIAKASQQLASYLNGKGQSAINAAQLSALAENKNGQVSSDVSAAASYMTHHSEVFTAIETHDVSGADGLSGVWNFEWAASGGLAGTAIEGIATMTDAFDRAIAKSAQITEITTEKKTGLDATKQRAQN